MIFNYLSGLREESCDISVNEILDFAMNIANKYLNRKRIEILRIISVQDEPRTITSIVEEISQLLCCPKSTVWMNVNFLKELGLIKNSRGNPVRITAVGMIILERKTEEKR
ncbi:MAG: hypothetical protein V3U72_04890 [Candidatus Aenigmarchaeota archaeon]